MDTERGEGVSAKQREELRQPEENEKVYHGIIRDMITVSTDTKFFITKGLARPKPPLSLLHLQCQRQRLPH
jgi:hypothetical protein